MLKIENLYVSYGAVKAIKGISLEVNDVELVSLIGANGAGKHTTLHTISGLVPAAVIARELNIRLVDTVCISSYTMRDQSASADILKRPDLARVDETWLVIDDLVDTGKTAKIVREMFGAAHFATVYAKPAGRALVDSFVTEVSQDTWVLFPWDAATAADFVPPIADIRRGMPED